MLLEDIFNILNESNLDYCVQNKYEIMPEKIPSDIDMMYRNCSEKDLDSIIYKISKKTGLLITQKIVQDYFEYTYILSYPIPRERFQLQLDFYKVISHKNHHNILFAKDLLDNKIKYKNFFIPSQKDEIRYIIVRRSLKKDFNEDHLKKLNMLLKDDRMEKMIMIKDFFGDDVKNVMEKLLNTEDIDVFFENYKVFEKSILKKQKDNYKIKDRIKYIIFKVKNYTFKRILKPCGFSVAFIAPDGAGKTTIINNINKTCTGSFYGINNYYFRPRVLKNLGYYNIISPHEEMTQNNNPHEHKLNGKLKSLIRFFYYNLDFIIGMNLKIRLQKIRKQLIIFDRYYYDYYLDLKRYQYSFNKIWVKVFDYIIPKPDLILLLDADENIILSRKQELELNEVIEQRNAMKELSKRKRFCIVDCNLSIEEVTNFVTRKILEEQTLNTRKKMIIKVNE